ncbi:MAG: RNA polymerase sigma factor [Defluviitaleaceae bacterium]|nr:RNA polymerase sigma factor [Defluviitaleaceae bacterium]
MSKNKNNIDFNALLERYKKGDKLAFDEIYKHCYGHIAFLCSKLCRNKEDAEEALQDTFMAAFKKIDEIRGETLLAFLRKIAARKCYDKNKSNIRMGGHISHSSDDMPMEIEDLDEDFLPEKYVQNKESRRELLAIISKLPPKQREMIYLYYYVDMNTEEIAKLQKCPSVNVRMTLHAARKAIKRTIEGSDKPSFGKYGVVVALASVLLIEEQAFAASYPTASIGAFGGGSAKVASTAAIVVAAAVVVVGVSAIFAYFALSPSGEAYEVIDPPPVVMTPILEDEPEDVLEEVVVEEEEYVSEEIVEDDPQVEERAPHPLKEEVEEKQEKEPYEAPQAYEPYEEEGEPEPEPEPEQDPEPEPEPMDRTPDILTALSAATNRADVNGIISYYGFSSVFQIWFHASETWFWFYVVDEGSGDILIGMSSQEDGSGWRLKFEHFRDATMPFDGIDLPRWMDA